MKIVLLFSWLVPYQNGTSGVICVIFSYYVITAKWLFSTITNRCYHWEYLINFTLTLYASSTRSFLDKSNINRDKPCSAEWLFATITKCCYQGYSFSIPLRANAICLKEKTMFKHRIWIQYYEKINQTMIEYFAFYLTERRWTK